MLGLVCALVGAGLVAGQLSPEASAVQGQVKWLTRGESFVFVGTDENRLYLSRDGGRGFAEVGLPALEGSDTAGGCGGPRLFVLRGNSDLYTSGDGGTTFNRTQAGDESIALYQSNAIPIGPRPCSGWPRASTASTMSTTAFPRSTCRLTLASPGACCADTSPRPPGVWPRRLTT